MPDLTIRDYQTQAAQTAIYPRTQAIVYSLIGLANESGEALGVLKKALRGDYQLTELLQAGSTREYLVKELGDVLWYLAQVCNDCDIDLEWVARANLAKLQDRQERGVLKGSGGER